jgi:CHAD domain-containing protein
MSFRISVGVAFGEDVRRIAREQIDGAIAETNGSAAGSHTERIHSVRKRCKKLRGLLRLVRPCLGDVYARENAYFRDAARVLAALRDTHVVLSAFDAVVGRFQSEFGPGTFEPLRRQLERPEPQATDLEPRLADVCGRMEAARGRIAEWPLDRTEGPEAWRPGFERIYRQARRALAAAYDAPTPERFHEWRKNVKYHWYHTRLLTPLWDQTVAGRVAAASTLGELLGLHHDLAVLRTTLVAQEMPGSTATSLRESFVALVDRHLAHLEATARPQGLRLFAERSSRIGSRYEKYWTVSLEEVRDPGAPIAQVSGIRMIG